MNKKAISYVALVWLGFLATVCCLVIWPKVTALILMGICYTFLFCIASYLLYDVFKDLENE